MAITKVTLRKKKLKSGKESLYLDFYPPIKHPVTGKHTRREFLNLQLDGGKDDQQNLHTAELIAAQRKIAVHNNDLGFMDQQKQNSNLFEFFDKQLAKQKEVSTVHTWETMISYLEKFAKTNNIPFKAVTVSWCEDFKQFLLDQPKLKLNSASLYFSKFKAMLRQAYKEEYTPAVNFADKVDSITMKHGPKVYLNTSERKQLYDHYVKQAESMPVQRAALFSMFTGLRFGDIKSLQWDQVTGNHIVFEQEKTAQETVIQIPVQALPLMQGDKRPFEGLNYKTGNTEALRSWLISIGINKQVTFHSFRHTFAIWSLENGDDIYTVSNNMGHKKLATTERMYAQFTSKMRRQSAERRAL